jgi:equilibrative nucleoside transporter 1/2/3
MTAGTLRRYKSPKDKCYCVYFVFFLQGIGMNFPWNVFITAVTYYQARLANTAESGNFENSFSFTYTSSNLLFILAVVMNAKASFFNMRGSVVIPQCVTALIFAMSTALVYINILPETFFWITLASLSFFGTCKFFFYFLSNNNHSFSRSNIYLFVSI